MRRTSPLPLRLLLLGALLTVAPACGKRGPPLPPLRPVPDRLGSLDVTRRGQTVTIRYVLPVRNADGSEPALLDHVDVYAMTVAAGAFAPTPAQLITRANRRATLSPKMTMFQESQLTVPPPVGGAPPPAPGTAPAAAPAPLTQTLPGRLIVATRFYALVPFATAKRFGASTGVMAVPLGPLPAAPAAPKIDYTEQTLTATWPVAAGLTFDIYRGETNTADVNPVNSARLTKGEYSEPVKFGEPVCFFTRAVRGTAPVFLQSDPSPVTCLTPTDKFAPAAPANLAAFAGEGAINLSWDAVTADDLGGYLVLRGEGDTPTLQVITTEPVTSTTFADRTARSGVRYTYAVVAVDKATPANRSKESNRVQETGR